MGLAGLDPPTGGTKERDYDQRAKHGLRWLVDCWLYHLNSVYSAFSQSGVVRHPDSTHDVGAGGESNVCDKVSL